MWQKYGYMWCWYCPMWQWNCQMWEKNKCTTEYARVQSYVMSVLPNVIMEPSNMRKKNKGTIECDKSMATCDVGTA